MRRSDVRRLFDALLGQESEEMVLPLLITEFMGLSVVEMSCTIRHKVKELEAGLAAGCGWSMHLSHDQE